jgi:hypothetical protein
MDTPDLADYLLGWITGSLSAPSAAVLIDHCHENYGTDGGITSVTIVTRSGARYRITVTAERPPE